MRFFRWCAAFGAFMLSSAVLFSVGLMKNPYGECLKFGRRVGAEYYLYSPSSQAKICDSVSLSEYFYLTGEKTVFLFETEKDADKYVMKWIKSQRARIVWEENIEGERSIYLYADGLGRTATLFGGKVNAHVVLLKNKVQIGFPIIFGGY